MRFFRWIIEFKIKRKENKERIKYLLERLIKELEQQGHNLESTTSAKRIYFSVFEHEKIYHIDGHQMRLEINKQEGFVCQSK